MLPAAHARTCYEIINETSLESLKLALYRHAVEYAKFRSQWRFLTIDQRREIDPTRTIAHNAFIDSANILSRNMAKQGEDNSWRAALGDDRKIIGDFACYIALYLALESR